MVSTLLNVGSLETMPGDIGEDASLNSVIYGLVFEEIKTAARRQFSLKFWKIKLVVHGLALTLLLALNQPCHFIPGEAYVDASTSFLDRPCDNRLSKMCAERIMAHCHRMIPLLNLGLLTSKK
jgi:hypothetical protein